MLKIDAIDAGYGETKILSEVSFTVEEGEVVALIGRNGAGKTTSLRAIMGILTPTAGHIWYRDQDITALGPTKTTQCGIGLVPEERRIFPELSVYENLKLAEYGGAEHAEGLSVDEALDLFENLADHVDSKGSTLSGGEQQMLTIARTLVAGVELILLDEPTEGLAPLIVEDVVGAIKELAARGVTVLIVEQNVHVGLELADRSYVIDRGRIVYEGNPESIQRDDRILETYLGVTLG